MGHDDTMDLKFFIEFDLIWIIWTPTFSGDWWEIVWHGRCVLNIRIGAHTQGPTNIWVHENITRGMEVDQAAQYEKK